MKKPLLTGAALLLAALLPLAAPGSALAKRAPAPRYYLALGDSLSTGFQPDQNGNGANTDLGYTNDLLATEARRIHGLRLVDVGCPGETTGSLLTGRGNTTNARKFHCDRKGGSQLKAALAFLKAHHRAGEVPLLTIDIGANDVDGCASVPTSELGACVTAGENAIKTNTPKILDALRRAAPRGTALVAMNLYDPVLAYYFSADPTKKGLAEASTAFLRGVNDDIQNADTRSGFKTADVAAAFHSYDATTVSWQGQQIPRNVAYVCAWTWACTTPPVGPNIHANDNGYRVIADTFATTIGRLR
jgi:lysophospholipase L1-like esterase